MMESITDNSKTTKIQHGISPEAWSTNSDSPTPTNSGTERPWAKDILWQGLLGDEHRLLLGTEEESSDRHSSDDDVDSDIESIYKTSCEQLEYYKKQFSIIQPDCNGLVSGQIAKVFFEKSGIPIEDLRHIWQLCDATKDGALSLSEFSAAMHLVVLRRNNIPLPNVLPPCLHLSAKIEGDPKSKAGLRGEQWLHLSKTTNTKPDNMIKDSEIIHSNESIAIDLNSSQLNESISRTGEDTSRIQSNANSPLMNAPKSKGFATDWPNPNRHWMKFSESPISNIASPGLKPVNFDMQRTAQAVGSDPQILHPVPLRITPVEAGNVHQNFMKQNEVPKCKNQISVKRDILQGNEFCTQQRAVSKKTINNPTPIYPQPPLHDISLREENIGEPPLPPPRPYRHARSSSLDLNKLKLSKSDSVGDKMTYVNGSNTKEAVNFGLAEFTGHTENETQKEHPNNRSKREEKSAYYLPTMHASAFEVYKKPFGQCLETDLSKPLLPGCTMESALYGNIPNTSCENKKGACDILQNLRKHNTVLLQICKSLTDELFLIQQQKQTLRCTINF